MQRRPDEEQRPGDERREDADDRTADGPCDDLLGREVLEGPLAAVQGAHGQAGEDAAEHVADETADDRADPRAGSRPPSDAVARTLQDDRELVAQARAEDDDAAGAAARRRWACGTRVGRMVRSSRHDRTVRRR
jgi:hypothetical protein